MASSKDSRLVRPAVVVHKRAAKPVVPGTQPSTLPNPPTPVQPAPAPAVSTSTTPTSRGMTKDRVTAVPPRSVPAQSPSSPHKLPATTPPAVARVQPATLLPAPARLEALPQPAASPVEAPGSSAAQQQRKQAVKALLTVLMDR